MHTSHIALLDSLRNMVIGNGCSIYFIFFMDGLCATVYHGTST